MSNEVATQDTMAQKIDAALFRNDLSKLTDEERVVHVHRVCRDLGLNPDTGPFAYITLNGRLTLYALRTATDQLRKINGVSIQVVERVVNDGLLTVHVRATDSSGRQDEDFGVVSVKGLMGEAAANAMMKAVTKAKRRVTLSISGLGYPDESEVEDAQPFQHLSRSNLPPNRISPSLTQDERSAMVDAQTADNLGVTVSEQNERVQETGPSQAERAATQPCELPIVDDRDIGAWRAWATHLMAYIRAAGDVGTINEWKTANAEQLAKLKEHNEPAHTKLIAQIEGQIAARNKAGS